MGAEFLVNSALFCIFLFFCARTSNSYVCRAVFDLVKEVIKCLLWFCVSLALKQRSLAFAPLTLAIRFCALSTVTCFPALNSGNKFFHPWDCYMFFPPLAAVTRFPTLGTGYSFPDLSSGYTFFRPWDRYMFFQPLATLHIFPYLAAVTSFSTLGVVTRFCRPYQRLHVFLPLAPVTGSTALTPLHVFTPKHRLYAFPP